MAPISIDTLSGPNRPALVPAPPLPTPAEVRRLLRDAAFVLRMTTRLKAEMVAGCPQAVAGRPRRPTPEPAADLGA